MDMPLPDARIISRKAAIVARLQAVLPARAVIHDPVETRAYECDGLSAYRCPHLPRGKSARGAAWVRHVAGRRCPAHR